MFNILLVQNKSKKKDRKRDSIDKTAFTIDKFKSRVLQETFIFAYTCFGNEILATYLGVLLWL